MGSWTGCTWYDHFQTVSIVTLLVLEINLSDRWWKSRVCWINVIACIPQKERTCEWSCLPSAVCVLSQSSIFQRAVFIHLVVCLTTGPRPLQNRALHIVRSRASSFKCEYPLFSLRSSSSFLRFLPRLPVTSIPPFIFPSITCCRRQFLCKMWPIQLAFHFLISCRMCIKLCFKLGTPAEESVRKYRTDTDISEVLLCIGTGLLTLILLIWRIWWANNASKWQMGFNSAFKGLSHFVVNADEMFV